MIDIRCSREGFKCDDCPIIEECEHIELTEEIDAYSLYAKGRTNAIDECKKIVMAECTTTCEYPFSPNCVECMTNKMEQLKEGRINDSESM